MFAVAWSPDGKRIASAGQDGTVQVWNATDGGAPFTYQGPADSLIWAIAWSPDGKHIASTDGNTVDVWNVPNGGFLGLLT